MNKTRAIALGLGLGVTLAGCSDDFLRTAPPDQLSDAVFWNDSKDAELAVNAIYPYLWGAMFLEMDALTDNALVHQSYRASYVYSSGTHDAASGWHTGIWNDTYEAIFRANNVLENIDQIPQMNAQLRERLKGEASFLRAYHYNNLVNLFGAVPLVLKTLKLDQGKVTRTPRAQVVDQILKDLDFAASVLPVSYGAGHRGRATKGAALALKARAALYASRWQEAAQAAKAVIDLNVYSLHPNYRDLFTYKGEGSAEVIFDRQQIKGQYASNVFALHAPFSAQGQSMVVPVRSLVDAYYMIDGLPISESPLFDPENPYESRDPRFDASLLRPGAMFNGKIYDSTPTSKTRDRLGNSFNATPSGYNLLKYIDPADASDRGNSGINFILIRYADVLLMYAEAKIELGQIDASVYEAINKVGARVGMPAVKPGKSQAELREIVRHERRVELALEGLRLFDIRRWKIAEKVFPGNVYGIDIVDNGVRKPYTVKTGARHFTPARDYLWPIPTNELELNPDLVQNPGY
jgi:hypothetical protein